MNVIIDDWGVVFRRQNDAQIGQMLVNIDLGRQRSGFGGQRTDLHVDVRKSAVPPGRRS